MHYTRRLKSYPDITRPKPSPLGQNSPFHTKQDKPPAGFSRGGFGPLVAEVGWLHEDNNVNNVPSFLDVIKTGKECKRFP